MNVATIIRDQIKAIDFWAFGAWGAKNLANVGNGLSFKTSGSVRWKGTVTVILDEAKDLYVVKFTRLRKLNVVVDKVVENVFVEDLVNVIDAQVG
jgi:hypothetical protein